MTKKRKNLTAKDVTACIAMEHISAIEMVVQTHYLQHMTWKNASLGGELEWQIHVPIMLSPRIQIRAIDDDIEVQAIDDGYQVEGIYNPFRNSWLAHIACRIEHTHHRTQS